jgi:hypothetical protein
MHKHISKHPETQHLPDDVVHYREYKILLQPDRFTSKRGFLEFWEDVGKSVKKLGLKVDIDQQGFHSQVREVLFYDTPDFDLYNNHFILRKRTFYDEGWPRADHELTLKYRNPDLKAAAKVDVRPRLGGHKEIKFKEELLLERDHLGGMRSVYSHGCVLVSPKIELDRGIENIASAFPALQSVDIRPKVKIELVNSVAVEEVQNTIGFIHFGHHYKGKALNSTPLTTREHQGDEQSDRFPKAPFRLRSSTARSPLPEDLRNRPRRHVFRSFLAEFRIVNGEGLDGGMDSNCRFR